MIRSRGYLPHLEDEGATYFITIRLFGTIPQQVLATLKREWDILETKLSKGEIPEEELWRLKHLHSMQIDEHLDKGMGDCWLMQPEVCQLVIDNLKFHDPLRYILHAWSVMPNHAHIVMTPRLKMLSPLPVIMHGSKSFTSKAANKILSRTGHFWQQEYYDHLIRDEDEFAGYVRYTLNNPVKAGLCKHWYDWHGNGCSDEIRELLLKEEASQLSNPGSEHP